MISLRYYSCDDVMVCCGWDSSQSQYHLLINKNKTVLEDLELKSISEIFENLKKYELQIPNSLMIDLFEDRASNSTFFHYYKEPVLVDIP
jgi:hypothetical protein